jgi:hypothetical protein
MGTVAIADGRHQRTALKVGARAAATYTVPVAGWVTISLACPPGGARVPRTAQPCGRALQERVSRTATLPSASATYAVCRGSSTATAIECPPTTTVGCGPAHAVSWPALHDRTSIIETRSPGATYAVCTGSETAMPAGESRWTRREVPAAATVEVCVGVTAGRLQVEVTDDGAGGAEPLARHGLQGLADRVTLAGGRLTVTSPAGGPTTVVADVPLDQ